MRTSTTVVIVTLFLFISLQPATALPQQEVETPEGQFHSVTIATGQDHDSDGYTTITAVEIQADTSLDDTDSFGNNPGEPYFEVEIDGVDVVQTNIVSRSEAYSTRLEIPRSALDDLDRGRHSITVKLGDADGEIDASDLGNDDLITSWEGTFTYETPSELELRATRRETVVGSPVAIGVTGQYDADVSWEIVDAPGGSSATIHSSNSGVATLKPDATGSYRVRSRANGQTATIEISASSENDYQILQRYAPRVELAGGEQYRPTRYEAFIRHARLQNFGDDNVRNPTPFDLVDRNRGWELDLSGTESQYSDYQQEYPPTVYGSVHDDVSFRGQQYDYAVTYWLFYVYDPKQADGISSLLAHQSDLETVTILVDAGTPQWVGASQHHGGELREWAKTTHQSTHVSIYPARGAHSNYLRDTAEYDGRGMLGQTQFIADGGTAAILSDSIYTDQTGGGTVLSSTGSGTDYELAVLTGNEYLANYDGSFGPDDDSGFVPMARERWTDVGTWLEERVLPDEEQVDTEVTGTLSTAADEISAQADIENVGPKPSQFWAVLRVKPSSSTWASQDVQTVATDSVRVGTRQQGSIALSGDIITDSSGEWDGRLVVSSYPLAISEQEDFQFTRTDDGLYSVSRDTAPSTSDSTAEPPSSETTERSTSDSSEPTEDIRDQNDSPSTSVETDSTTPAADDDTTDGTPGFTLPTAMLAVIGGLLLLGRCRVGSA